MSKVFYDENNKPNSEDNLALIFGEPYSCYESFKGTKPIAFVLGDYVAKYCLDWNSLYLRVLDYLMMLDTEKFLLRCKSGKYKTFFSETGCDLKEPYLLNKNLYANLNSSTDKKL